MKKFLRKFAAVIAAATLLVSIFPMAAFAEGDIEALTIEMLTGHQPADMITENLTLPEGYTWTSSDESVMTSAGVINPKVAEDTEVTLTAEDANGTSESFEFVVKSVLTEVIYSEDFYYPKALGFTYTFASGTTVNSLLYAAGNLGESHFKFRGTGYSTPDNGFILDGIEADEKDNQYLHVNWTTTMNQETYVSYAEHMNKINACDDILKFKFDFNYAVAEGATNAFNMFMYHEKGSNGYYYGRLFTLSPTGTISNGYRNVASRTVSDGWNTIYVEVNMTDRTTRLNVEGNADGWTGWSSIYLNDDAQSEYVDKDFVSVRFHRGTGGAVAGTLDIDNFSVYRELDWTELESDALKAEYIDSKLKKDAVTAESAGAITSDLTLDNFEGYVTWTSSDESAIKVDGETGVIQKNTEEYYKPVTLTATAEFTDTSYNFTKKFSFAVAPSGTQLICAEARKMHEDFEGETDIRNTTSSAYGVATSTETGGTVTKQYIDLATEDMEEGETLSLVCEENADRGGIVGKISYTGENQKGYQLKSGGYLGKTAERFVSGFDFRFLEGSDFIYTVAADTPLTRLRFDRDAQVLKVSVYNTNGTNDTYADYPLPEGFNYDAWHRVDVDMDTIAACQTVYIDGAKITPMPINIPAIDKNYQNQSLRNIGFGLDKSGTVLLDNIAIMEYSDDKANQAYGALRRMVIDYSGKELSVTDLPTLNVAMPGSVLSAASKTYSATFTWSGEAVSNNKFSPTELKEYELTVTSEYESVSYSDTITVLGMPGFIDVSDSTVKLITEKTDGVFVAAKYETNEEGTLKLSSVEVYDLSIEADRETATTGIALDDSANYKFMFWDSFSGLTPLARCK